METSGNLIKIDLVGRNSEAFDRLSGRLVATIESVVEKMSNSQVDDSTRSTLEDIAQVAQSFIQAKAQKPTIENQKMLAEISHEYAAAEEKMASARKINAEAESVEIANAVARLESAIKMLGILNQAKLSSVKGEDSLSLLLTEGSE